MRAITVCTVRVYSYISDEIDDHADEEFVKELRIKTRRYS
jgi:hypothetical protein